MIVTKKRWATIFLLVISVIFAILTSKYSKVNSTTSTLLLNYVLIPALIIEAILVVSIFLSQKSKVLFLVQAVLSLMILYWFIDYVFIK